MHIAPIPENEAERLAALRRYDILDTPAEADFDDISRLAAQICGAPIALISLVDEGRQWFKSRLGLQTTETSRDTSLCAHAILNDGLFEVPDTASDVRFADNPAVTLDPHMRFYAGQPLLTPEGLALGTLCVIDRTPRTLTREQRDALRVLGSQVVKQLELRRISRSERVANERLQRQIAEQSGALRETEQIFRMMVAGVKDYAIIILDPDGRIVTWNPGAERLKGHTAEEIVGKHFAQFYTPEDRAKGMAELALKTAKEEGVYHSEGWRVRKDGSRLLETVTITSLRDDTGQHRGFAKLSRDVTESRQTAAALAESEERFRQLAEQSSDVFWFVSLNPERIVYLSPSMERLWGLPAQTLYSHGRAWLEAVHPDDRPRVARRYEDMVEGRTGRYETEYRVVRPDGTIVWILDSGTSIRDATGAVVRLAGIAKDITENKHATAERLRMQRLESIGTLSGGIAHDLNNALAPILLGLELLRLEHPNSTEMIDTMETSARHGAGMVRQLLTFAKGMDGARVLIHSRHLFTDIRQIVAGTFPKNIELRVICAANVAPLLGDPTQLHQVLLNLCVNARDAMPAGGRLTLAADVAHLDDTYVSVVPEARPGRYVVWRVEDTGTGIPPEILERIFEPFFTTKAADKGTGLGLSTVRGIVKSHGGFVRVRSAPGKGTTFTIHFPCAEAERESCAAATCVASAFRGNGETVLVVDDVADVRDVSRAVLTALNFKVLTASDGAEAVIIATQNRSHLRAVITDQHMPQLDGLGFVRVLKRILPAADIIVASGRLGEREASEFKALGASAILEKPFTQETLIDALTCVFCQTQPSPHSN